MDDAALQHAVVQELEWARHVDADDIRVSVRGGVVRLTGSVLSLAEKKAAERTIWHVRGVNALVLELQIRDGNGAWYSDEEIAQRVVAALGARCAPLGQIRVTVESGVVWLAGMVEDADHSTEAERIVREVPGVLGLENRLTLRPVTVASSIDGLAAAGS